MLNVCLNLKIESACFRKCPSEYYDDVLNWTCNPCDRTCATCKGGKLDECISCNEPRFLYQSQCTIDCPDDLYRDEDRLMCVTDCK